MKQVTVIQHVPFEGPAMIAQWAGENNYSLKTLFSPQTDFESESTQTDLLVIMGGPMNVDEHESYPWLLPELDFIRKSIQENIPVLGICLGAQLIAKALGANVYPSGIKEIGWAPVHFHPLERNRSVIDLLKPFSNQQMVFHWHGDTFELPQGAVLLASSKATRNQAFLYGDRVVGLQFHFEMDFDAIQKIADACREELIPAKAGSGGFILSYEEITKRNQTIADYISECRSSLFALLEKLIKIPYEK